MSLDSPNAYPPLTERILARLGPPRRLWITVWAAIPLISPFIYVTAIRSSGFPFGDRSAMNLVATQAALAWACFVLLRGAGVLAARAISLGDEVAGRAPRATPDDLFRGMERKAMPVALTILVAAISVTYSWVRYGPLPALVGSPLLVVYVLPIMTFVSVYLAILGDIDRLGRHDIVLDTFPQDRTLGLEHVGSVAWTGLGLLLLAGVPVLLAGSDDPVTLGISLTIVAAAVGLFILSMWRLHRQMAAAKARYVAIARRLYAEAYAPLRDNPTAKALEKQSSALSAAQSLAARAEMLVTWPIDEGTLRFMAVVITGVITGLVVRGLFAAIGF